jgi:hypothetical protein
MRTSSEPSTFTAPPGNSLGGYCVAAICFAKHVARREALLAHRVEVAPAPELETFHVKFCPWCKSRDPIGFTRDAKFLRHVGPSRVQVCWSDEFFERRNWRQDFELLKLEKLPSQSTFQQTSGQRLIMDLTLLRGRVGT